MIHYGKVETFDSETQQGTIQPNAVGDAFALYGYSGYGRGQVDFFVAKEFDEAWDDRSQRRLAQMTSKLENRDAKRISDMKPGQRTMAKRLPSTCASFPEQMQETPRVDTIRGALFRR